MGLGYDRMLGFAVVVAGLEIGWTAGIVNIYTTGFSQQMIGLPIFSAWATARSPRWCSS